ncbi:peptide/nickel transport system substrate-binding protein [Sinosporangium album]|uniref:Peptide/nickel transport system substrate-binding protein n=1 Tax=Sinosporangium album TaxID=504805 RepID=A0A1G8KIN4_9ACTN|nr:ABC transporter substrate-binding protein [Sinosporangium album]SDI43245.1 peptide/nickel transport system substrate-binding protein [Sinosporangium album]
MKRTLLRRLTVLALAASLTAACSTTPDPGAAGDAKSTTAGGPSGILRIGTSQKLDDWEPLTKANETYLSLVYEGLISLAADGVTLEPRLATSWTQENKKVEFTLREGVVFHDGTPFDADAVVANLERVRDSPSQWQSVLENAKITAVDKTHVAIELERSSPDFLPNIARRGALMVSPKALKDGTWKTQPSGTGPWTFQDKESVPGFKTVVSYFDKYYAPQEVGPRRIEMSFIAEADSVYNSLRAGQLDMGWTTATLTKKAESEGFRTSTYPSVLWHLLLFDTKETFKDPKLRQAVCHALNPQDFIDILLGGHSKIHNQRLREGQLGYNPDVKGYPHDLAKAKALMAELGNPKIEFAFPAYDSQRQVADLFRSQMAAIGIDVSVQVMPFAQYYSVYRNGKFPVAILSDSPDTGPYDYYRYRFGKGGSSNPYNLGYPNLDAIVKKALEAPDRATEEAEWKNLIKEIDTQALDCGFFEFTGFWAYDPKKVDNIVNIVGNVATFRYKEARVLS